MTIGKLGFGKDDFFYGLELCLQKAGRSAYTVTEATASAVDVLLVTLFWWRDVYLLERFLRRAKIRPGGHGPLIIAGGMQATMTPEVIAPLVDCVFIGDADDHLGGILDQIERGVQPESPYLYRDGDEAPPAPAECAPSAFAMRKGGARDVTRIEIARGCRFRCGFCALTGLKSYREVPFADIAPMLPSLRRKPCSFFAPERVVHSEWPKFQEAIDEYEIRDHGQDVRLEGLRKIKSVSATFGLEGISYRLRKLAGKPWGDDYILETIGRFVMSRQGISYLSAYFIADLPGEDLSDWDEIYALFERIEKAEWSRRLTLKPILNPFSPKPFTPLAGRMVHPFRDYEAQWRRLLRRGGSSQWGFRCVETVVWGPFRRLLDALVTNGGRRGCGVVRRLPDALLAGVPPKRDEMAVTLRLLDEIHRAGLTDDDIGIDPSTVIPSAGCGVERRRGDAGGCLAHHSAGLVLIGSPEVAAHAV